MSYWLARYTTCPQCGGASLTRRYCAGGVRVWPRWCCRAAGVLDIYPHLGTRCRACGFAWAEGRR